MTTKTKATNTTKTKITGKGGVNMTKKKKSTQNNKRPKRLKKYRMDAGFSIYSLADRMEINPSTISYWENGVKFPRPDKLMELEDLFGENYRELFTDLTEEEIQEIEDRLREFNSRPLHERLDGGIKKE